MSIDEARRLSRDFRKLNMSNYDEDDVETLNDWACEVVKVLDELADTAERQFNALESIRERAAEAL